MLPVSETGVLPLDDLGVFASSFILTLLAIRGSPGNRTPFFRVRAGCFTVKACNPVIFRFVCLVLVVCVPSERVERSHAGVKARNPTNWATTAGGSRAGAWFSVVGGVGIEPTVPKREVYSPAVRLGASHRWAGAIIWLVCAHFSL